MIGQHRVFIHSIECFLEVIEDGVSCSLSLNRFDNVYMLGDEDLKISLGLNSLFFKLDPNILINFSIKLDRTPLRRIHLMNESSCNIINLK